ncbi:MAG: YpdA family putative bacillithiol disulfide reductase [candidate division KSB1 bacterium]
MSAAKGGVKNTFDQNNSEVYEVVIVGAGPIGLACGIEAQRRNLSNVILEKGCLTDAIFHFPQHMTFFSTPELLEVGDIPFVISSGKPTRQDALTYYRRVAIHEQLQIRLFENVTRIERGAGCFEITSAKAQYRARTVVLALGFYDHPNLLNVPGEDLPKVSHYYSEPHPFYRRRVAIVGGKNSAVEAALELYRHGAEVTLIHRHAEIGQSVKYWILPDILNRIKEGSIRALLNSRVTRITPEEIFVQNGTGEAQALPNDFVFALTGYHPDYDFLRSMGIAIDEASGRPEHNPATFETNVSGLYIAGCLAAGKDANKIFIENGRLHAKDILGDIAERLA